VNSNMSLRTSQRTCELRNEVRNICGQSFVKSTVKLSPGWGIFHSQLAQGPCISLQVVSRHPGIYTIITNQIKCPGVFPGGGMVTPGIDSCISDKYSTFTRGEEEGICILQMRYQISILEKFI
jgi:hypothetical protein